MTVESYEPRDPAQQDALLTSKDAQVAWENGSGWYLSWNHGCLDLTMGTEAEARAIAALCVHWWLTKSNPDGITSPVRLRDAAYAYFHPGC